MGVISTALYLATPAAAAGTSSNGGAVAAVDAAPSPPDPARAAPVVFDLPATARAASLDEAIAQEVARDAVTHSSAGLTIADSLADGRADGALNEAVIAAHDARIAMLRQRIDATTADGAAGRIELAALQLRLHRAEAARRIALARAGDNTPAEAPQDVTAHVTTSTVETQAVRVSAPAKPHPGVSRPPSPRTPAVRRIAVPVHPRSAHATSALRVASTSNLLADHGAGATLHHVPVGPETADAAGHVRRLLAAARRVLEADAAVHPPHVALAGLMHWEGSETWSLADCAKRVA